MPCPLEPVWTNQMRVLAVLTNQRPALPRAEVLKVLSTHVGRGATLAVESVLQHKHGGPVLLRPLVPHAILQHVGVGLVFPLNHEKSQAEIVIVVKTSPVSLVPNSLKQRIK